MPDVNVFRVNVEYEAHSPEGYQCGEAPAGSAAGGKDITVRLYELPSGQSLCPYHYEYEEEWLLVLDGDVLVRSPNGEAAAARGELRCFPAGPAGAHKVTNRSEAPARVLMWSSSREPAVAVYPDSDKIGVWPPNPDDRVMLRRADGQVDYWDEEV
ncbi:MAG: cupin domain-containing protein [Solirubrobacterales bacterium]|nr:cupin domain-containing protein [Solirubrobacterales bacterium]MBV9717588.1 cupin domain-containing protein [Solirubrobacterales bacterium]